MKTDLLLKLAALLETVPNEQFYYGHWIEGAGEVGECGTTACALGWATTMPETGLFITELSRGSYRYVAHAARPASASSLDAASVAFELTEEEADSLFMPSSYYAPLDDYAPPSSASPARVAEWIRKVVASYQKENE